jgi:chaperone required for assembly of F1-ATPase
MKRFYRAAVAVPREGGWQVELDGRPVKTQGGRAQLLPSEKLAAAMACEWQDQGQELDPTRFVLRDLADFALDTVAPDPGETLRALLLYAETDTLCYRAEPGDALLAKQDQLWEPLLRRAEIAWDLRFVRVAGVIHQPQPPETLLRLQTLLAQFDPFALAALRTTASLAASLVIGLLALEPGADAAALWDAANLEEDWQAEHWGTDADALALRTKRSASFDAAVRFAELARGGQPTII